MKIIYYAVSIIQDNIKKKKVPYFLNIFINIMINAKSCGVIILRSCAAADMICNQGAR